MRSLTFQRFSVFDRIVRAEKLVSKCIFYLFSETCYRYTKIIFIRDSRFKSILVIETFDIYLIDILMETRRIETVQQISILFLNGCISPSRYTVFT